MALYEHIFIARHDLPVAQAEALVASVGEIITSNGGKVHKVENWGPRTLAYKIAKNRKGQYAMLEFEGPNTLVAELERQLQISEDVIRYLTVKVDAHEEGPSVMTRKGSDKKPRRDRDDDDFGFEGN